MIQEVAVVPCLLLGYWKGVDPASVAPFHVKVHGPGVFAQGRWCSVVKDSEQDVPLVKFRLEFAQVSA